VKRRIGAPSLVGRLIILAAGWSLLVLLATGLALTAFFNQAALSRFDQGLRDTVDGLYAGSTVGDGGEVLAPPLTDARALRAYSGKYWQLSELTPQGGIRPLVRSRSLWDSELPAPADPLKPGATVRYDTRGPQGEPLRAVALTGQLPGRQAPVVFMAAEDRTPVDKDAQRFAVRTAIALVLLGAGIILAVFIQVRIGLQPLFALKKEVASLRRGRSEQVTGSYPAELAPLAQELNALVVHNREVIERQRTHVGNLAHALKTPLSVMLEEARLTPGPLADTVSRQAQTMQTQVDHHLRRARTAARSQSSRDRTRLAPVLDELSRTLERIFRDKGVEIDWDVPDDLAFQGERQDLLEMAGNAMENAAKFSKRHVRVTAERLPGERLRLNIEDDGPGVAPERREEMLERGSRLDESAPGSGLGLSIIDDLARAYGGSIGLDGSDLGGLKVCLELPSS
jgi:signal transduction histidine kinase